MEEIEIESVNIFALQTDEVVSARNYVYGWALVSNQTKANDLYFPEW